MFEKLYCDLDGVLADFLGGASLALGKAFDADCWGKDKSERWHLLNQRPAFWESLPKMRYAKYLWSVLAPHNPWILTACPEEMPQGEQQKKNWCNREFGIPHDRVIVVFDHHKKSEYAVDVNADGIVTPNLLIDDYRQNCERWVQAGGIAIQHFSAMETIDELSELFS
jgi:5'-nucleotidase